MKQRGFTLIELIGMVLILALVFLVSYPNFVSMSKNEEKNKQKVLEKNLCLAGESYIYQNKIEPNNQGKITIDIKTDLLDNGYIDQDIEICQKQNDVITSCTGSLTFTVQNDKSLYCEYSES